VVAKIRIEHETNHSSAEIREKVNEVMAKVEERFGIKGEWSGDTYRFKRSGMDGSAEVSDGKVVIAMNLGMMLSPLKGRIRDEMLAKLKEGLP
jgi:putative polyhydroxyalkanoate system protein